MAQTTVVKFKLSTIAGTMGTRGRLGSRSVIWMAASLFDMLIYKSITADNPGTAAAEW